MILSPSNPLKRAVLFLLFLYHSEFNYAQPTLDSLLLKIQYQNEDTNKAKLYYDIGVSYFLKDKVVFKSYIDSLQRLSRKINYSKGLGLSYSAYANYYSYLKDWDKMKVNLQKSDSIYKRLGDESKLMFSKGLYSTYYKQHGDFKKALKLNLEILYYYEQNGSKSNEARFLGSVALLLQQLQRYKEATEYYKRSIRLREEINDFSGQSVALLNLGGMLAEQGLYAQAEPYLKESIQIQKMFNQENIIIMCKSNLAHVYAETGRPHMSLNLAKECSAFFDNQGDTLNSVKISLYKSIAYSKLKQFDKALSVLNIKQPWIKGNPIYSELESNLLWQYYKVYKSMGKTDKALEYFEESRNLNDFSQKMQVQDGVSRMKEQFETEKKERENEQLKRDNELKDLQISQNNYLVFGSILLILLISVIAIITIRYNRLKAQKATMEMEQRLLQSQMNPHFTFNVLHAIHTYMLKKDTEESGKLLTSFARLVRAILQHSSKDSIPLSDELNWLKDYMRLQQLRFTNSFNYIIEIDEQLSSDNVLLPPMLIQPFIENAIEHGFSNLDKDGELHISYKKTDKELEIRITDNGKGFSTESQVREKKDHESVAIQITEKRINLLNRKRKGAFKFEISSTPLEGTIVFFSIPYNTLFD
jgi:tetratricopeptide (TPR) repeat protein